MQGKAYLLGIISTLAMSAIAATPVIAKDKKPALVKYQKDSGIGLGAFGGKLVHSYGYKDKKLENGSLQVTGQAKSDLTEHSQYIALYRAAEIASLENKKYIKILSVNGKGLSAVFAGSTPTATFRGTSISYGTRYVIEFELSDAPDDTDNCATDVVRQSCRTVEVAGAMQEIRPHLKF